MLCTGNLCHCQDHPGSPRDPVRLRLLLRPGPKAQLQRLRQLLLRAHPGGLTMSLCDASQQNDAVYHVSLSASIFDPKNQKTKRAQFWHCETCERASQQILANDRLLRRRIAFRFVDNPTFMSPYLVRWSMPKNNRVWEVNS